MVPSLDYLPRMPRRKDYRIGCVGAGFIMRDCHLVAYRQAGFNPVAIASRTPATRRAVAQQHGIPRCHDTIDQLLDDSTVEVLDIAVPPDAQPAILRAACRRKDHVRGILAQKPLALSVREARQCVEECAGAGITLAVNQNMRYDQSVRALKDVSAARLAWRSRARHHRDAGHSALDAVEPGTALALDVRYEHPSSGHVPLLVRHARPRPRQHAPRSAHALSAQRRHQPVHPRIRQRLSGQFLGRRVDRPAREGCAGDIAIRWRVEGTEGLRAAPSAGRAIRSARRARWISPRAGNRIPGSNRAGPKCGSPTPSSARWPNCCVRWRRDARPRSAVATIWRQSPCARPSTRRRPSIASPLSASSCQRRRKVTPRDERGVERRLCRSARGTYPRFRKNRWLISPPPPIVWLASLISEPVRVIARAARLP